LASAAVTMTLAKKGIDGLAKMTEVSSRGIDAARKAIGFTPEKQNSWAYKYVMKFVPVPVKDFLSVERGYAAKHTVKRDVMEGDKKVVKDVEEYVYGNLYLVASGAALSLLALIALDVKHIFWRPTHPIVNEVLSYVSPFRLIAGESWVANGINRIFSKV
jgi:hypothetical protein